MKGSFDIHRLGFSLQIFPYIAYRAKAKEQIFSCFEKYTQEVTVLAPSAWDPNIRLEPPKNLPSLDKRLSNLANRANQAGTYSSYPSQEDDKTGYAVVAGADPEAATGDANVVQDPKAIHADNQPLYLVLQRQETRAPFGGGGADGDDPIAAALKPVENESLMRTGRLFGGLILDVKRKLPWFASDFRDAFHIQTLASIIYIYLATITKAITFGGFLGDITGGLQGVLESFLGHALAGGMFCLFGGQPLTVLGCTGPVLIFEKILIDFSTYVVN